LAEQDQASRQSTSWLLHLTTLERTGGLGYLIQSGRLSVRHMTIWPIFL
jgi:hypothetical protein